MISKDAIKRGYNRGNYTVGAHTRPTWATDVKCSGGAKGMQIDPVELNEATFDRLRVIADEVLTSESEVITWTRDWWAGSMIAETQGTPATSKGVIVRVSTVEQIQDVMRLANKLAIPVTVSAGRSNVTGAALPLRGGIVLDVCNLNKLIDFDPQSQIVESYDWQRNARGDWSNSRLNKVEK